MKSHECNVCHKIPGIMEVTLKRSADNLLSYNSFSVSKDWGKGCFRPIINSLYYALKAYNCEGVKCLFKRVRSFKKRMFFMSASAVEEEAHALAAELYAFLES